MSVAGSGEDFIIKHRLAEFFVISVFQNIFKIIQDIAFQTIQVIFLESRFEDRFGKKRVISREIVSVHAAGNHGHLCRNRSVVGRR